MQLHNLQQGLESCNGTTQLKNLAIKAAYSNEYPSGDTWHRPSPLLFFPLCLPPSRAVMCFQPTRARGCKSFPFIVLLPLLSPHLKITLSHPPHFCGLVEFRPIHSLKTRYSKKNFTLYAKARPLYNVVPLPILPLE